MTRSFCGALLALFGAGFLPFQAQAQVLDRSSLLPPEDDKVQTMPIEPGKPIPMTTRYGEFMPQIARDSEIVLEPSGVTRRAILNRLFADRNVQIEWRNKTFADERVQDRRLTGPPIELARRLLARVNYIMFYERNGDERSLTRIVILGSDPPSITHSADAVSIKPSTQAPAAVRQDAGASEAQRRRAALEATHRAIPGAQR